MNWEVVDILFRGKSFGLSEAHSFISCLAIFNQHPVKAKRSLLTLSLLSVVWIRLVHFWNSKNTVNRLRSTEPGGTCICSWRNIGTQNCLCCSVLAFQIKIGDRYIRIYLRSILWVLYLRGSLKTALRKSCRLLTGLLLSFASIFTIFICAISACVAFHGACCTVRLQWVCLRNLSRVCATHIALIRCLGYIGFYVGCWSVPCVEQDSLRSLPIRWGSVTWNSGLALNTRIGLLICLLLSYPAAALRKYITFKWTHDGAAAFVEASEGIVMLCICLVCPLRCLAALDSKVLLSRLLVMSWTNRLSQATASNWIRGLVVTRFLSLDKLGTRAIL